MSLLVTSVSSPRALRRLSRRAASVRRTLWTRSAGRAVALIGATILGAVAAGPQAAAQSSAQSSAMVVAELYTSQGCNSCPAADAYLGELAGRDDVLPLSFHIDYWDYLGWKDRFAKAEHTARQRAYQASMRIRAIYTPQLVIQGSEGLVGHRRGQIERALTRHQARGPMAKVVAKRTAEGLAIEVAPGAAPQDRPAGVWAIGFDRAHTVKIERGENAGRTLTYYNVVKSMRRIGRWNGVDAQSFAFTPPDGDAEVYAVIIQRGVNASNRKLGRVLGAAIAKP